MRACPVIVKEHPDFNSEQLKLECEIRWNRIMDTIIIKVWLGKKSIIR